MKVRILGCGTSSGVPRLGNRWGTCDPTNPKNRRSRVSILVEQGDHRVLIDTSPDMRQQLLDADVQDLDAVFWTHDHADHTHGLDDLRGLMHLRDGRPMPCYGDAATLVSLRRRFAYVFAGAGEYRPSAEPRLLEGPVQVGPMTVIPFEQEHGAITSLGFRIGKMAYSTDVTGFPPASEPLLRGLDLWIVDCLRPEPHPTHAHLDMTLEWIDRYKPGRAVLTHMDVSMDYQTLREQLPDGIEPGFDGMEVMLYE
jgi:phosphoribosyl 1,2-cyclic phosphate phosphodiesterase